MSDIVLFFGVMLSLMLGLRRTTNSRCVGQMSDTHQGAETVGPKASKITFRMSADEQKEIVSAARAQGYASPSAFARAAVRKELANQEQLTEAERRIAATMDRVLREVGRLSRQQQALFALVDTLTKTFLTCVPEPPADAKSQAIAVARHRYDQFMKSAGRALQGGSQRNLQEAFTDAPQA